MLIILIILISLSLFLYKKYKEITLLEAIIFFISSVLLFIGILYINKKFFSYDYKINTYYIIGKVHHDPYYYWDYEYYYCNCKMKQNLGENCKICKRLIIKYNPEKFWIIKSKNIYTKKTIIKRDFPTFGFGLAYNIKKPKETCIGYCHFTPQSTYNGLFANNNFIEVSKKQYNNLHINDIIVEREKYYNPVKNSNDIISFIKGDNLKDEYYKIKDYKINRIYGYNAKKEEIIKLEELNAKYNKYNINVSIRYTNDKMYFEQLKRKWKNGKSNDFIVIIFHQGNQIKNVNILGWDNFSLKSSVQFDILNQIKNAYNINGIIDIIDENLNQYGFKEKKFDNYDYININLPWWAYILSATIYIFLTYLFIFYLKANKYKK